MTAQYSREELLEILLGESSEQLDRLIAACEGDAELTAQVQHLSQFDSLLRSAGTADPRLTPSPELLALYLHEPDSLEAAQRMAIRLHLAVSEDLRRDLNGMRRFAAAPLRPASAPEGARSTAPATDGALFMGWSRARVAAAAGALLVPVLGYASYSAWDARSEPTPPQGITQVATTEETPASRAPGDRIEIEPREVEPAPAIPELARALAPPPATELPVPAEALEIAVEITGMGVTNPDQICEALDAGAWDPESPLDTGCGDAFLAGEVDEALTTALAAVEPASLPLPSTHLDVSVLRMHLTEEGDVRIRAEVQYPDAVDGEKWTLQASLMEMPEHDPGSFADLELEAAVFTNPQVCDWAEENGVAVCQFYSRFVPALVDELPRGPVWFMTKLAWHQHDSIRAHLTGFSPDGPRERVVFLERDEAELPHWNVTGQAD